MLLMLTITQGQIRVKLTLACLYLNVPNKGQRQDPLFVLYRLFIYHFVKECGG